MTEPGNQGAEPSEIAVARLFTGLDLPDSATAKLRELLDTLRPAALLRWSPPENLHITTKFIGNWPVARMNELKTALGAVEKTGAVDVEIRGLGWFPNPHQPHTFWTGIQAGPALAALHTAIDTACDSLGIAKETKAYSPHLTLARVPREKPDLGPLRRAVAALESVEFGSFRAGRFFLYQSKPGPTASVYSKLAEFSL
jgi:2'-5' RNA ligase